MALGKHKEQDEHKRIQRTKQPAVEAEDSLTPEHNPSYPTSLLADARLNGRGNQPVRTALMRQMQQTYGNRAVQRYLQRAVHRPQPQSGLHPVPLQREDEDEKPVQATPTSVPSSTTVQRQVRIEEEEVKVPVQAMRVPGASTVLQRRTGLAALPVAVQRDDTTATATATKPKGPSPYKRKDIVFIMGTDSKSKNKFYSSAEKYFKATLPNASLITKYRSLDGVFAWLRTVVTYNSPVGNIYIVSHANEDGTLSFPLEDGSKAKKLSYGALKNAVKNRPDIFKEIEGIDEKTTVHIKGCNIGRSKKMLDELDKAFGGKVKVTAPTHKQGYEWHSTGRGKPGVASEFLSHYVVERPGNVKLSADEQRDAFQQKYGDLAMSDDQWKKLVPAKGVTRKLDPWWTFTAFNSNVPATKKQAMAAAWGWFAKDPDWQATKCTDVSQEDDGSFTKHKYEFDAVNKHKKSEQGTLTFEISVPTDKKALEDAKKSLAEKAATNPDQLLSRPADFQWRVERKKSGQTETVNVYLEKTSYIIEKELKDSAGDRIHPDEKPGKYFGESTYTPPPTP